MDDTPEHARLARHEALTAQVWAHAVALPAPALQLAWEEALRAVLRAENNTAHTFALGYAMGVAGGWLRAGLIDSPTYDALTASPVLGDSVPDGTQA